MNEQIYINEVKHQIESGTYDHLFKDKKDLVFLDIGANIGLVSIYSAPYCRRIISVEPAPETFKELVYATCPYAKMECLQVALAPVDGPVEFFVNDLNFTASSTVNTYGLRIMVEGQTLMMILDENDLYEVDVCKIDAEGAEGESLSLLQLDAASSIIKTYYIEFHNCPSTTWEHKLGTTVGNLARCGYHHMEINGMSVTASK